ncbi:STAS domain-containing protein [Actinokineospora sp. 24-640]
MSTLLTLRQGTFDDAVVVYADGEIDMATAPQLADALHAAIAVGEGLVVADLVEVRFLGSAGMGVLVSAADECGERGQRLVVATAPTGPARRSLQLTGLDRVLTMADDLNSALRAPLSEMP